MRIFFVAVAVLSIVVGLNAAKPVAHLEDTGGLLASEAAWTKSCELRLAGYERDNGIRILVEFHLKSPSEEEDKKPGAYMHALARKLGVDRGGVLVVYFHDDPDWRVWIGDELTNLFTGQPGTVQELTASEAIHNAKEAMLSAAAAKAKTECARVEQAAPDGKPLTVAQRLAIQTDTLLDALQAKFVKK